MTRDEILSHISRGRTDLVIEMLALPDWQTCLEEKPISPLSWFIYYNDVTALKTILSVGGTLKGVNLDHELNSAAFFGHWKVCDFLIAHGADPNYRVPETQETALHSALCKAGRPYFYHTIRLLLERGADIHAVTKIGAKTGGFMRDARTKGETALHRAAAFADPDIIQLLLDYGADRKAQDGHGDTPLSWASWHLRPGAVLQLLAFPPHTISDKHVEVNTSDHGERWGNAMERNFIGDYLPLS